MNGVKIGFNIWEVVAGLSIVGMVLLGICQYHLSKSTYRIRKRYSDKTLLGVALFAAVLFGLLLALESAHGITQVMDGFLTHSDSEVWSLVLTPIAIVLAVAIAFVVYYLIAVGISYIRFNSCKDKAMRIRGWKR